MTFWILKLKKQKTKKLLWENKLQIIIIETTQEMLKNKTKSPEETDLHCKQNAN